MESEKKTKKNLALSLVVPVYNRPSEIEELLESMVRQSIKNFEVVIVEDGSTLKCDTIVNQYKDILNIKYFFKENTGPGQTRNYGCEKASGNYFIFLDSDCILPPHYAEFVYTSLSEDFADAFGGSDRAHESFSSLQKAINYAMTSFFTTGGIRGSSEKLDKFYPRSFNMGLSKEVFEKTGGFPAIQFANVKAAGEDIELSIHIMKEGFSVKRLHDAYVYHKRRTDLKQFFKQTFNFGIARISLFTRNQGALKAVHLLPALFVLGSLLIILLSVFISAYLLIPLLLYTVLLFFDATIKNKNLKVGLLATIASYIQLTGYGIGFINAFWKQIILKKSTPGS